MYFNYVEYFIDIMLYYVVGDHSAYVFWFGNYILITYQNSPKSVFYLFLWVQAFSLV